MRTLGDQIGAPTVGATPERGPEQSDRDPEDIRLSDGAPASQDWSAPYHWEVRPDCCYCCGGDHCHDIEMPTQRYYLCRVCALTLESELLGRAMAMIKWRIDRELGRD